MAKFIDVAPQSDHSFYIDAENVSVVSDMRKGGARDKDMLCITTFQEQNAFAYQTEEGLTPAETVKYLREAGTQMFEMSFIWGDEDVGVLYVNPVAFQYVVTSEPFIRDGETEERVAIIMGVDGQLVESSGVKVSELDAFMDAVRQVRPDLKRVTPETASARFYKPGYTDYDPAKISQVYKNGSQVNVHFGCGGTVDFNIADMKRDWGNFYLQKRVNKAPPERRLPIDTKEDMQALQKRVYDFKARIQFRLQREFAKAVAADAPDLIKVSSEEGFLYSRFKDVARLSFWEDHGGEHCIYVEYNTKSRERGLAGDSRVYFKDLERAKKEFAALLKKLDTPKL